MTCRRDSGESASPYQAPVKGAADALEGAVDGNVEVCLHIIDDQGLGSLEAKFEAAALVYAATRTIDISEMNNDTRYQVAPVIRGMDDTPGDVLAQPIGQGKVTRMDLNIHDGYLG